MSDNKLILCTAIARYSVAALSIYFAFILASNNKDGWGWMIFLGLMLGAFGYTKGD